MAMELSKNPTVLVVNDTVFAHGGLLPEHGTPCLALSPDYLFFADSCGIHGNVQLDDPPHINFALSVH